MAKRSFAVLVAMVVYASSAQAAIINYVAHLNGGAEVPVNQSPGFGLARVTYDDVAHTLDISAVFDDLIGTTTMAHIHCCTMTPLTGTAGVATTTPSFVGFPLGVTEGTFNSLLNLTLASSWNPAFITANGGTTAGAEAVFAAGLASGRTYFNIHTTFAPGGEIRDFLQVPEPASISMIAIGLGAAIVARRRRRKKF